MAKFSATVLLVLVVCAALYAQTADGAILYRKKPADRQSTSLFQQLFGNLFGSSSSSSSSTDSSTSSSSSSSSGTSSSSSSSGSTSGSTSSSTSVSSSNTVTVAFSADQVQQIIADVDTLRQNAVSLNNAIDTLNNQQKQMNELLGVVINLVGP